MNKVYAVIETTDQYFDNDLCWEDGYYDDYYETVVLLLTILPFLLLKKKQINVLNI